MKVRQLKRRVRKVVYYEWRTPPRRVEASEAAGSTGHFGIRLPAGGHYAVSGHGFGWKPVWVRPR